MVASYAGDVEVKRIGDVITTSFVGMGQNWGFEYRMTESHGEKGIEIYLEGIQRGGNYPHGISDEAADELELKAERFVMPRVLSYLAKQHSDVQVYVDEATRTLLAGNKQRRLHTVINHVVE